MSNTIVENQNAELLEKMLKKKNTKKQEEDQSVEYSNEISSSSSFDVKNLFFCSGEIELNENGNIRILKQTRIVFALNMEEAEAKFINYFTSRSRNNFQIKIIYVDIFESIE